MDNFHVLCGVDVRGRLEPVEGMQEKMLGVYHHHVARGTWAQMAPPANGFDPNNHISVAVAFDQVSK
jgi:GTPase